MARTEVITREQQGTGVRALPIGGYLHRDASILRTRAIYVARVPTGLPHRNRRWLFEGLAATAVMHAEAGKSADQIAIYVVQHLARFRILSASAVHEVAASITELGLTEEPLTAASRARSALERCAESLEEA